MKNQIQLAKTLDVSTAVGPFLRFLFYTFLSCSLAVASVVRAVTPAPDEGDPIQNTTENEDAFSTLATGADNTAMGFDALDREPTGSTPWLVGAGGADNLNTGTSFCPHGDVATERDGPGCRGI